MKDCNGRSLEVYGSIDEFGRKERICIKFEHSIYNIELSSQKAVELGYMLIRMAAEADARLRIMGGGMK